MSLSARRTPIYPIITNADNSSPYASVRLDRDHRISAGYNDGVTVTGDVYANDSEYHGQLSAILMMACIMYLI